MEKTKIIKIAVIGAESTGKSTLVKDLALYFNTVYVDEYAREYFNSHDINNYSIEVFDAIYKAQIENENKALQKANTYLFCDTTLITGKIWCEEKFGKLSPFIEENIGKIKYDLYLVANNDVEWVKDNQRKNPHNREELFQKNIYELETLGATYEVLRGTGYNRLINAIKIIEKYFVKK